MSKQIFRKDSDWYFFEINVSLKAWNGWWLEKDVKSYIGFTKTLEYGLVRTSTDEPLKAVHRSLALPFIQFNLTLIHKD